MKYHHILNLGATGQIVRKEFDVRRANTYYAKLFLY